MNKLVALFSLMIGFAVLTPVAAEAGHGQSSSRRVSHHCDSCGSPVYKIRVRIGCDRHGCPIYAWRTLSHRCAPRDHCEQGDYGHDRGYSRHGSGRRSRY